MAARKKPDVIVEEGAVYVLRAGTKVYVKTADVCAMTGKSNQWIGQLTSQGIINRSGTPHGSLYEVTGTMKAYCAMLGSRAPDREDAETLSNEKAKLSAEVGIKKAKAIVALLEANELQGKMHRAEDVAALTEDLVYTIRGMLIALPGRLAVDVAGMSNPAEVAEAIRKEVHMVMRELANYRYDPKKYEERVRERQSWSAKNGRDDDDD